MNVVILSIVSRHVYGSALDLPSYFWPLIQKCEKMLKLRRSTSIMPFAQQNIEKFLELC